MKQKKTWVRKASWPKGLLRHKGGWFFARLSAGGNTRFLALKTDDLGEAKRRCSAEVESNERNREAVLDSKKGVATMGDILTLYRVTIATRAGVSDRTRELNLGTAKYIETTWPELAEMRPADVKPTLIQEWRDRALQTGTQYKPRWAKASSEKTSGRSASSFNKAVDMIRRMLDLAVDKGAVSANILAGRRGLKASDRPKKPVLPEPAVLQQIFAEIESVGGKGVPAAELCRLLAFTGCRRNEAAALTWADVDFARGLVSVKGTKTAASKREVPMIPAARNLLEKIRQKRETNATETVDGKPHVPETAPVLKVREAQKSLDRACAKLKVNRLTHHDLRDAFATTAIESGVDVPTVAAWLGHADGGALLMRVYQHHRRPHSIAQAAKVDFGGAS